MSQVPHDDAGIYYDPHTVNTIRQDWVDDKMLKR